jgi:hypothetical protein
MVKEITAYLCEKCGYYSPDKKEIEKHEKKPVTGIDKSIDGLVFKTYYPSYNVIRRTNLVDGAHDVLYIADRYYKKSLNKYRPIKSSAESMSLVRLLIGNKPIGYFDAQDILHYDLYGVHGEKLGTGLSAREFKIVTKKLRLKYPELYGNLKFKRESKHLWFPKSQ